MPIVLSHHKILQGKIMNMSIVVVGLLWLPDLRALQYDYDATETDSPDGRIAYRQLRHWAKMQVLSMSPPKHRYESLHCCAHDGYRSGFALGCMI